jgi:hypothetical protein
MGGWVAPGRCLAVPFGTPVAQRMQATTTRAIDSVIMGKNFFIVRVIY